MAQTQLGPKLRHHSHRAVGKMSALQLQIFWNPKIIKKYIINKLF